MMYRLSILLLICLVGIVQISNAQTPSAKWKTGEVLLQLDPSYSVEQLEADLQLYQGKRTQFNLVKHIVPHSNIWHARFSHEQVRTSTMLQHIRKHSAVRIAQYNHILSKRDTLPNDALIQQQWQYVNDGSNGGVVDADIDADQAWEITTGGLTSLGDTIVVCVIDDGIDTNHDDFDDNIWINHAETPDNGIDDDNNGFIDDYYGWNAYDDDDNIDGGWHGTPVAGIVGAQGNNGNGVTGVNWDVKLMIVVGGGDEAAALAAYAYPLALRKRYNETNGAEGAFVVATNASWGVDFGQPADAPLWCAMYDTLGAYGVLNAGATINGNVNVDVDGDLPTGCASEYLISVTNMDRTDNKVPDAGYGAVTIDLGAFGADTYTTSVSNTYGGFGGTSGATPHVAGAIALLYSSDCNNFAELARNAPATAASLVKSYILNGGDPNVSLQGITTSGNRLNLFTSLQLLGNDCGGCYTPLALSVDYLLDTTALITWDAPDTTYSYIVEYSTLGSGIWDTLTTNSPSISLMGLKACSEYEVRISSACDTLNSAPSRIEIIRTEGCCSAPEELEALAITDSSIVLGWNSILAASDYTIEMQAHGSGQWVPISTTSDTLLVIPQLTACLEYPIRIYSNCPLTSLDTITQTILTKGCGACIDSTYCIIEPEAADFDWIESVSINGITNPSGNDGGYAQFTDLGISVYADSTFDIILEPGIAFQGDEEIFRVWIDYDQDGLFLPSSEEVFVSQPTSTTITATLSVPATAEVGLTRMRINMAYEEQIENPCGAPQFGEVEDYCLTILESPNSTAINPLRDVSIEVYPNPVSDAFTLSITNTQPQHLSARIYNIWGQSLWQKELGSQAHWKETLSLQTMSKGIYWLQISSEKGSYTHKIIKNE